MFSWKMAQERAVKHYKQRMRSLARSKNPDLQIRKPDYVRDATKEHPIYDKIDTDSEKEIKTKQQLAISRRMKLK
jgi:hypothetical protein